VSALSGLQNVASAALAMYVDDFAEAKRQIELSLHNLTGESLNENRLPLRSDLALALASTGETSQAEDILSEAQGADWSNVEADEHLIACGSMIRANARLNREVPSGIAAAHATLVAEVKEKLGSISRELAPAWHWKPLEASLTKKFDPQGTRR
jgi:hypothetical protein